MTKKEIVLATKYNVLAKYTNLVQEEVLITIRKLIRSLKDSDTEESKKIIGIVGEFLTKTEIIAMEYPSEEGTKVFSSIKEIEIK